MKRIIQSSGIKVKAAVASSMLLCGVAASALAQAPVSMASGLPSLPKLPSAPMAGNINALPSANINMPSLPTLPSAPSAPSLVAGMPALPSLPSAPNPSALALPSLAKNSTSGVLGSTTPPPSGAAGKDFPDASQPEPTANTIAPPKGLPTLPFPARAEEQQGMDISLMAEAPTSLPEIDVVRDKPKQKTWLTKLAPSIIPPHTDFNYKRAMLPETIYSRQYSRENAHLPRRVTREDYSALLFKGAAINDTNAVRALLNAGAAVGAVNDDGETPLMVAERAGAVDVVALLSARGAKE